MNRLLLNIVMIAIATTLCSCGSLVHRSRPYYASEIRLSQLSSTRVEFNHSKYDGISLIVINDLDSDVFLKFGPRDHLLKEAVNTDKSFRLADMDERGRLCDKHFEGTGVIVRPIEIAEDFMLIWAGNKGFYHYLHYEPFEGEQDLPITYYHCND